MNERLTEMLDRLFAFDLTAHLLRHDFVQQALVAGALLGLVAGLIGPFIVMRQMSFAVHGSAELSLTGAAFALLAGFEVGIGALVGSALAAALFAGYGLSSGAHNWMHILGVAGTVSLATYVIIDLEFPRLGLIRIDSMDRALLELRETMG